MIFTLARIKIKTILKNMDNSKSKGLGDTIEKITKTTGVKRLVDLAAKKTGKPCGCAARKGALNKIFPYKK